MRILFRFLIFCFIMLFMASGNTFCTELHKFTAANFDTSNSIIVLSGASSPEPVLKNIKLIKLENKAYFDIDNAFITFPKQNWIYNSGIIKEIKINQFSNNPCKVRVVLSYDDSFNPDNIKFYRLNNNIIIKLKSGKIVDNEYYHNTYRDEHASSSDFYEYLTVMTPLVHESLVEQIQDQSSELITERKELRLNTKYYLNNISVKSNGILLNGFGAATIERPMILQNPARIVYDLPNTLVNTKIRNKDFKINENETVKIGQFSVNKARIVITTEAVSDYIPIYSSDNQSLLIADYKKINSLTLYDKVANAIGYYKEKKDPQTESMILKFDAPVVHGLDRYNDKLIIYLYNVSKYNDTNFKGAYQNTFFKNAVIDLIPKVGLKLTIPVEQDSITAAYLGADGKSFKITVKQSKKKQASPVVLTNPSSQKECKKVVIDAGHGGTDTGAIGGNTKEKDITLDIAKRVEKILQQDGYNVKMTRTDDTFVSLQDRVLISENYHPDIFVSIHVNSSVKPEITGIETHYYHQESMPLAQTVHSSFASAIQSPNRGLFKSKFYVINHTTCPAILIEIGFISNMSERLQLTGEKRKQATAKAIADGIKNYFKQHK